MSTPHTPLVSGTRCRAGARLAGALAVASSGLLASPAFAQATLDCSASTNEVLIYCNDFETRATGSFAASTYYRDLSSTGIASVYGGTEDKDPAATVNGIVGSAFVAQSWTVETLRLNADNYQTTDSGNQYSIGIQQNEGSAPGTDSTGGDLLAFTFDARDPATGAIAPVVELQLDFAPAFLTTLDGTAFRTAEPWGEPPRMQISLFDGQLTTNPGTATVHPDLDLAAVSGTPTPLSSQIITGGAPVAATAPISSPVAVNFVRHTVSLSTAGITNPNGTVTVLLDVLADSTAPLDPALPNNQPRKYATFDNLRISVLKNAAGGASVTAVPTLGVGALGLLSALAATAGGLGLRRRRQKQAA